MRSGHLSGGFHQNPTMLHPDLRHPACRTVSNACLLFTSHPSMAFGLSRTTLRQEQDSPFAVTGEVGVEGRSGGAPWEASGFSVKQAGYEVGGRTGEHGRGAGSC